MTNFPHAVSKTVIFTNMILKIIIVLFKIILSISLTWLKKALLEMSAWWIIHLLQPSWMQVGSQCSESHHNHWRTIHAVFALNWPNSFKEEIFRNIFPIGSYCMLKLCPQMVAILNFRSAKKKKHKFCEVLPMIIHATNQFNWPSAFWQEEL